MQRGESSGGSGSRERVKAGLQAEWSLAADAYASRRELEIQGRVPVDMLSAIAVIEILETSGSYPVLVVANDQNPYWLKWPGNPHNNHSLASELVVALLGALLQISVRPGGLVYLPPDLIDGQVVNGCRIQGGTCFGSLRLASAEEATDAWRTARDDNKRRYAGIAALWDLCLGDDLQVLHDVTDDSTVWSFDHGLWFCNTEADWDADSLRSMADCSWDPFVTDGRLDAGELMCLADRLESLSADQVADAVCNVPVEWQVPESDLRALAGFIWSRRRLTAFNMRVRSMER